MDFSSISMVQLGLFVVICLLLALQMRAKKQGLLVKVDYSKSQRMFWAVLVALIPAFHGLMFGNYFFIALAVAGGIYLYFVKQYYTWVRK